MILIGNYNTVKATYCVVRGDGNVITGDHNDVFGNNNAIYGDYNSCNGTDNTLCGKYVVCNEEVAPVSRRDPFTAKPLTYLTGEEPIMMDLVLTLVPSSNIIEKGRLTLPKAIVDEEEAPEHTPEQFLCCICLIRIRKVRILDCDHRVLCVTCSRRLFKMSDPKCPICRIAIVKGGSLVYG